MAEIGQQQIYFDGGDPFSKTAVNSGYNQPDNEDPDRLQNEDWLKKISKSISGAYMSPGSGCVDKKHFVRYVDLVFGCLS